MLTEAAVSGKIDRLTGLKENVIIGKLIPARYPVSEEAPRLVTGEEPEEPSAEVFIQITGEQPEEPSDEAPIQVAAEQLEEPSDEASNQITVELDDEALAN